MDKKRVFFALKVEAPWPQKLPPGRVLEESQRHITLAFIGDTDYSKLQPFLPTLPVLQFSCGLVGKFDSVHLFPSIHPHVVAWGVRWVDEESQLNQFQKQLLHCLQEQKFLKLEEREFIPHVTLCRQPFSPDEWQKAFVPLPFLVSGFYLYESLGNSHYNRLWGYSFLLPFEELEHTADIAFLVRGETFQQLYIHAQAALAFRFPHFFAYLTTGVTLASLEDVVILLNEQITQADAAEGCPFKAVSFHGEAVENEEGVLTWEMIIDV